MTAMTAEEFKALDLQDLAYSDVQQARIALALDQREALLKVAKLAREFVEQPTFHACFRPAVLEGLTHTIARCESALS